MWTEKDSKYWMEKEKEIKQELIDVEPYGFIISRKKKKKNWKCLLRRDALEALLKARSYLPKGLDFKLYDGWRPWSLQKQVAAEFKRDLEKHHPKWTKAEIMEELYIMAPPIRIVPKFNSHRYGGAVDLTLCHKNGKEVNMGVPVDSAKGKITTLLFYELKGKLTSKEKVFQKNRKILIRAMARAGFDAYLPEFWHWGYPVSSASFGGKKRVHQLIFTDSH